MRYEPEHTALVICGGLPPEFVTRAADACAESHGFTLSASYIDSSGALEVAVAAYRPEIALLPESWLLDDGLELLVRLEAACPHLRAIVVGAELSGAALARALPLGLRGLLRPQADSSSIARAIATVLSGELWLSRRQVIELVNSVSESERTTHSDTWRDLPALTEREHTVLHEVLADRSNREIARDLEISEQTVKIHLQHIYRKLGVRSRLDLLLARS
jgi:two-component system, NarL family, nitrate/nitrite response regulator NarL